MFQSRRLSLVEVKQNKNKNNQYKMGRDGGRKMKKEMSVFVEKEILKTFPYLFSI